MIGVILGELTYSGQSVRLVQPLALCGILSAFLAVLSNYGQSNGLYCGGVLCLDGMGNFFKLLFLVLGGLTITSLGRSGEVPAQAKSEITALVLAATLAMCLEAASADLPLAFLSWSLLNTVVCLLVGIGNKAHEATHAALRFLAFSVVSLVLFLYALALLFGHTRSLNIYQMHRVLAAVPLSPALLHTALNFIVGALSFPLAVFPMSIVWPDLLEGAPTPIAGFLSVGYRAAGFALAIRFVLVLFAEPAGAISAHLHPLIGQWKILGALDWPGLIATISGLSLLSGALLSTREQSARRLVGALVVGQSGFLLMGLLVLDDSGLAVLLYNLVVELFALVGIYYVLGFYQQELKTDRLEALTGMLKRALPEGISLILYLACLVGMPPTPGFIGKFALLAALARHGRFGLVLVAVIALVIMTLSVARLAFGLTGNPPPAAMPIRTSRFRRLYLLSLIIPLLSCGIWAEVIVQWATRSIHLEIYP